MLRGRLRGAVIGELKTATGDESAAFDVDECVTHWLRSNGAQLHNTAAVLGGIASQVWRCGVVCQCLRACADTAPQEMIKIITQQYVPIDNALIWNGIKSRLSTFSV